MTPRNRNFSLLVCLLLFGIVTALVYSFSFFQNNGNHIYVIDDAYIHMAIAKNFSQHGVWGVTPYGFTSSASSLFWPLLLSLTYLLFGVGELSPFVLNCTAAILAIIFFDRVLRQNEVSVIWTFVATIGLIFLTPLVPLLFCGMEHTFHILFALVFTYSAAKVISQKRASSQRKPSFVLLASACFLATIRYEGLFIIFVAAILLFAQRKWRDAIWVLTVSFLPLSIFAIISMGQGWLPLPNSVLAKASRPVEVNSILNLMSYPVLKIIENLEKSPVLSILLLLGLVLFIFNLTVLKKRWFDLGQSYVLIFMGASLLHVMLARVGGFYRYQGYLIAVGIVAVTFTLSQAHFLRKSWTHKTLIFFLAVIFSIIGMQRVFAIPRASKNIYEQQYQMAIFIAKHYPRQAVAINDIGAVCYLSDIRCLDLFGLADMDVFMAKAKGVYSTEVIRELAIAHHVKIAIVYDHWYEKWGGLPREWTKIEMWTIQNNVVCDGSTVTFYAVDPVETEDLCGALNAFARELPNDVIRTVN